MRSKVDIVHVVHRRGGRTREFGRLFANRLTQPCTHLTDMGTPQSIRSFAGVVQKKVNPYYLYNLAILQFQ